MVTPLDVSTWVNYLSNKLGKAIQKPTFNNLKRPLSLNPSSASVKTTDGQGNTKIVGACHRQQYYRITGQEPDDAQDRNLDWTLSSMIGDKMHQLLVELVDVYGFEMGIQRLAREHAIYDKITNLSGRTDLIAWDYNKNEPIGIEIKSIGEYKAKKAMEQPIEEHVLQSIVYLHFYNKMIPPDQKKIAKWYLWYISRTENWTIKSRSHGSDFTMLWDYYIELDNDIPIVHLGNGISQRWVDYSIDKIYERYEELTKAVDSKQLPPRDYEVIYSEEKIAGMYKQDQLSRKADKEAVEKWLKKGATPGKLKVTMGDPECMFCEFNKLCWNGVVNKNPRTFSNLPVNQNKEAPEEKRTKFFI